MNEVFCHSLVGRGNGPGNVVRLNDPVTVLGLRSGTGYISAQVSTACLACGSSRLAVQALPWNCKVLRSFLYLLPTLPVLRVSVEVGVGRGANGALCHSPLNCPCERVEQRVASMLKAATFED